MSGGIEVNTSYKGVAASWLGLDPNFYSKKRKAIAADDNPLNGLSCNDNGDGGGTNFTKHKNFKKQDPVRSGEKNTLTKQQQTSSEKKKSEVIKTNGLIKNKIEKRLQFNARDKHEFKGKKRKFCEEEDEEESKSFQVKNKKMTPQTKAAASCTSQGQTIQELNTRLLDPNLSKKARKRIRKKIASLTT